MRKFYKFNLLSPYDGVDSLSVKIINLLSDPDKLNISKHIDIFHPSIHCNLSFISIEFVDPHFIKIFYYFPNTKNFFRAYEDDHIKIKNKYKYNSELL